MNYERFLIYPRRAAYSRLLPRGNSSKMMDLSKYGLICEGEIGEGGFAKVYRAYRKNERNKPLAVKITRFGFGFPYESAKSSSKKEMLRQLDYTKNEILIAKQIGRLGTNGRLQPITAFSPTIAEIDEYRAKLERSIFSTPTLEVVTVSELAIPYEDFRDEILFPNIRRITEAQAAALALDMFYALKTSQEKRIIHRDIKAENFLLTYYNGKVSAALCDYNISRTVAPNQKRLNDFTLSIGSFNELHPDQLKAFESGTRRGVNISTEQGERYDVYKTAVAVYMLFNGNQAPPKIRASKIPYPCNSPSNRFSQVLIELLQYDINREPLVNEAINRLQGLIPSANQTVNQNRTKISKSANAKTNSHTKTYLPKSNAHGAKSSKPTFKSGFKPSKNQFWSL